MTERDVKRPASKPVDEANRLHAEQEQKIAEFKASGGKVQQLGKTVGCVDSDWQTLARSTYKKAFGSEQ